MFCFDADVSQLCGEARHVDVQQLGEEGVQLIQYGGVHAEEREEVRLGGTDEVGEYGKRLVRSPHVLPVILVRVIIVASVAIGDTRYQAC